ncbi:phage scaffolding protein [Lapidilactobacillus gannanensis]|uniref:Phage scaffolding protein n=1 Tax=Lapidilactobacillus gannanensis TaxID=2486002 RepID=A0ABW4BMR1_9LACO|nr:phage scaffolding protein [Lapidilactobacillus gannanensis]
MKREELKAAGLSDELIEKVMAMHGADINELKGQITQLETEKGSLNDRISESDKQMEALKKSHKGDEELQKEIDKLTADNKAKDEEMTKQLTEAKIGYLTELGLTKAGAKNIKATSALLDKTALSLDKDGNVSGLDDQIKALQAGDDTKFLFGDVAEPAKPNTPTITVAGNPTPNGSETQKTMVEKIQERLGEK